MLCAHSLFNRKILYTVALYIHLSVPHFIFMHIARECSCWYILWKRKQHIEWITSFSSCGCVCVCFVIPCEAHLFKHLVPYNTVHCQIDTNIRFRYASSYINLLCIYISILLFPPFRSSFVSVVVWWTPIAWIVIWRTYNAFILIHCHHRHHHHHPTMDEIFNSNGITLSLLWFWFISFGGYHKWSNFPAMLIKMFNRSMSNYDIANATKFCYDCVRYRSFRHLTHVKFKLMLVNRLITFSGQPSICCSRGKSNKIAPIAR